MFKKILSRLFLDKRLILILIILNALTIMISAFEGLPLNIYEGLNILDNIFTILFIVELIVKIRVLKSVEYFSSKWNILDFALIILSTPALISWVFHLSFESMNIFLLFRIVRVFKSFRFIKFVPGMNDLIKGIQRALRTSLVIIIGFSVYVFIIGLLSCYLFREADPEHFSNPVSSFYAIFKVFTLEGWSDIPDDIQAHSSLMTGFLVKLYFVFIVVTGGILGLSLVNSIFVEAMLSDNNDDLEKRIAEMDKKLDQLLESRDLEAVSETRHIIDTHIPSGS